MWWSNIHTYIHVTITCIWHIYVLVYYTLLVVIIICIMLVKLKKCWRMLWSTVSLGTPENSAMQKLSIIIMIIICRLGLIWHWIYVSWDWSDVILYVCQWRLIFVLPCMYMNQSWSGVDVAYVMTWQYLVHRYVTWDWSGAVLYVCQLGLIWCCSVWMSAGIDLVLFCMNVSWDWSGLILCVIYDWSGVILCVWKLGLILSDLSCV